MKKIILVIFSFLFSYSFVSAQKKECGTMEHLEYLKTQDPQLENLMLKMSKQYKTGLNRILPL